MLEDTVRLVGSTLALVLMALASAPAPSACECVRLEPLSPDVRREAPIIFSGTVVEIVERNEHTTTTSATSATTSVRPLERRVVFRVIAGWRGVTGERVGIDAEISDCMVPFEIGEAYLLFANTAGKPRPWTSICTRTTPLARAADILRLLGAPAYRGS
jgi:hypothetical protein